MCRKCNEKIKFKIPQKIYLKLFLKIIHLNTLLNNPENPAKYLVKQPFKTIILKPFDQY